MNENEVNMTLRKSVVYQQNLVSILLKAIRIGDENTVQAIFKNKDFDINFCHIADGTTLLHNAVSSLDLNVDVTRKLLTHPDINVNVQDNNLDTALHQAVKDASLLPDSEQKALALLASGANPLLTNKQGQTAVNLVTNCSQTLKTALSPNNLVTTPQIDKMDLDIQKN